jgi:hypothetical protein
VTLDPSVGRFFGLQVLLAEQRHGEISCTNQYNYLECGKTRGVGYVKID